MVGWFRRYWADTIGNMEKISSGQTFTDILNFAETLTLNAELAFFNRTLWLMMLYHQTKFGCKLTSSLEDTSEIVIFWLHKPLLWPWLWTHWTNFSAWYSGLWCCTTIPGLVTKCSVVQKISSRQTFTDILNLHCDLDLESSNPHFSTGHSSLRCGTIKPSPVANWPAVQKIQQKKIILWLYKPSLWPWH